MNTYNYRAAELAPPSPHDVRAARLHCGLTQSAAAALVYRTDSARWREWEREGASGRTMHPAFWELLKIKTALIAHSS